MPIYQQTATFVQVQNVAFNVAHSPGERVPFSGIYRCDVCGYEDACNKGDPFPPQLPSVHAHFQPIRWRLVCMAIHKTA